MYAELLARRNMMAAAVESGDSNALELAAKAQIQIKGKNK